MTVKAAPETSKKHGECVCTAGITEEGEFIRLYPITLDTFRLQKGFKKFDWIEVECKQAQEKLNRKESYRVRKNSIRVVDDSLSYTKGRKTNWELRNKILYPLRSAGMEELRQAWEEDRTSLGLIRVAELLDLYRTQDIPKEEREDHKCYQMFFEQVQGGGVSLGKKWILKQIPHIFRYTFRCESESCPTHDMTCEDWELFESYRKWPKTYGSEEVAWQKIIEKYLHSFREKDLHFFMGMYSQYPTWMIIGLYYPPRFRIDGCG